MSSYATKQDLINRFGETELIQLTDRSNMPQTTIDDTVVDQANADAGAEIDGYLAARYTLPLETVPERLEKVASDMARFYLHGKAADESVRQAYEDGVKWLDKVSKGMVQLGLPSAGSVPATGGVQSSVPTPLFPRDDLEQF